jgi:uncharacterized protein (DUF302 family)
MLQVASEQNLDRIESALRQAAQKYGANVQGVARIGEALSFSLSAAAIYKALLTSEIRMSAFLPCRIAAYGHGERVTLETIPPAEFCRLLNRPDLAPVAAELENLLTAIMDEAAKPLSAVTRASAAEHRGGLGATEEQMSRHGTIPQRIDSHGTKVEELGGTGKHDAQGG